jgi:hypothetical protein
MGRKEILPMEKKIRDYLARIGAKGGKAATGESKVRGNSEYYRRIRKQRGKKGGKS